MSHKIDINSLAEAELIELNNRIVERLRFLHQTRAHNSMLEFSVGDQVSFQPEGRDPLFGILTKYNRKTVTVLTEQGQRWNVAPVLLRKVKDVGEADAHRPNIVEFRKK